jgi:hypothetical protein
MTWPHDRAFAILELQQANNPAFALELAPDLLVVVMQAAAISRERPTRGGRY